MLRWALAFLILAVVAAFFGFGGIAATSVEIDGHKAILLGTVRSYAEMRDAERAARNAPGVTEVENRLTVDPTVYAGV